SDVGTHGGEWVLVRRDVAATTIEGYREHYLQTYKRQPFASVTRGAIRDILMSISTFLDMLADPWIILADWNYEPPWWKDKPWLSRWNGAIVTDPACTATRDKGKGSVYDYAIVRSDIASRITVGAVYD
ncbi:unnamed protein product, partial [Prorocentrum cordatum]